MLRTSFNYNRVAVFAGHQDLALERYRRSCESRGNRNSPAFVLHFTSLRIDASENAAIGCQVKIVAVQDRRGHVSSAFLVFPQHVWSAGEISVLSQPDRVCDLRG